MWRWIHLPKDKIKAPYILYGIEKYLKIPVFPNHNICWHYDNKIAQYYILKSINAPIPNTWIFWDKNIAINWAKKTDYPIVFKLSTGAGSSNVIKLESEEKAIQLINNMFDYGIFPNTINANKQKVIRRMFSQINNLLIKPINSKNYGLNSSYPPLPDCWWQPEKNYCYFQEFLDYNKFDTRVTVIGDRAFCYRRFNRKDDFRASGSGNFDVDPKKIDINCVKKAFKISKKLKFQSMAYDFLFKNNNPTIIEMSYTFVDWMVHDCLGYWNSKLEWIKGKMWPEEAQVEDFIRYIKEVKSKK
jgi:hypothetical protein